MNAINNMTLIIITTSIISITATAMLFSTCFSNKVAPNSRLYALNFQISPAKDCLNP